MKEVEEASFIRAKLRAGPASDNGKEGLDCMLETNGVSRKYCENMGARRSELSISKCRKGLVSRHLECESLVRFSPASPGQWMLKSGAAGSGGVGGRSLLGCPWLAEDAVSASAVGLVRKVSGRLEC